MLQHAVQAFLIAAILAPFSFYVGQAARKLGAPQITGYLISGIICGPYCLSILSHTSVADLNIIEGACLGIIGLAAGAELYLPELAKHKQQVVALTISLCITSWLTCYAALSYLAGSSLLPHLKGRVAAATATLGATIMMARSPASAIAVLKEMEARGPFSGLVMGVVVLKDVVVILAFAVNLEWVGVMLSDEEGSGSVGVRGILLPVLSVCVSISSGLLVGYLAALGLQYQVHALVLQLLQQPPASAVLAFRCRCGWLLLCSTLLFQAAHAVEAEPLLACVTAGMVLANRRGPADSNPVDVTALINSVMTYSNVAFFGLAGASLKLTAIRESVIAALVVVVLRLGAVAGGSHVGCAASGVKPEHQRVFWMSMITQAGVALGLARIAGTRFSGWGLHFQTLMMAIIMINMLIGPPLFRMSLLQVGEAHAAGQLTQQLHRDGSSTGDLTKEATVVVVGGKDGGLD